MSSRAVHTHTHTYIYIYIYIERERERERDYSIFLRDLPSSVVYRVSRFLPKPSWPMSIPCCPLFDPWRHEMGTFSVLPALCEVNPPVTGGFTSQGPVTRIFDVFLICAWRNGWANNRNAGDLRRHCTHHDVRGPFHERFFHRYSN